MQSSALSRIQALGDLGLAPVLCLVAEQHGIVLASPDELDDVAREMAAICTQDLGLTTVVLDCSGGTNLDHFRESVLVSSAPDESDSTPVSSTHHLKTSTELMLDDRRVADVLILKHLSLAHRTVQIQALELMRARRIYTREAMHSTSHDFVLIALDAPDDHEMGMDPHLNDAFALAHRHRRVDDDDDVSLSETSIMGSLRKTSRRPSAAAPVELQVLHGLRTAAARANMTAEVSAYVQNVVVALRLHRYVARGITAVATRHLRSISRAIAVLHGLDYVTPAVVGLAVRKVYLHRLVLADEHTERSLRWGGDPLAVRQIMHDVDVETAIDAVIASVQSPL